MADWADTRVSLAGRGSLIATATTSVSGGAVLATAAGISIAVRVTNGVAPVQGDRLLVVRHGSVYWAIATIPAPPTATPAPTTPPDTAPDPGDTAPAPKPTVTTGTLTCVPTATSCYRDGSWRSDGASVNSFDLYQGRYSGSSFGRMTGVAFYGSKPHSLSGATCTKATVKLKRLSAGDYSAQAVTLRLVSQTSRPSGAPTLNESTSGPALKIGDTSTFTLPDSWGQALIDGTRGGIAINVASDSPYIHLAGRGSWSAAMTLTISWRRSS